MQRTQLLAFYKFLSIRKNIRQKIPQGIRIRLAGKLFFLPLETHTHKKNIFDQSACAVKESETD